MRQSINYFLGMLALFVLFAACTRDRSVDDVTTTGVDSNQTEAVTPAVSEQNVLPATQSRSTSVEPVNSVQQSSEPTATPVPGNTPQSGQPPSSTFQYTVEPGDTLFSIAERYGTDIATVQQLNFLFDDNISAGQVIRLPLLEGYTAAGLPTATPVPFRYPIQSGETLSGIAAKFGVSTAELVNVNNIVNTDSLYVGQEIIIPGRYNTDVAFDSSDTNVDNSSSVTNQAIHIVSPGEGLLAIAERYSVSASDIATANNIQNRELLRTGQRLFIPGVSANEAASINSTIHTVAAGQSLLQIAVQYDVAVDELTEANNIQNIELIYPGQQLVIPNP